MSERLPIGAPAREPEPAAAPVLRFEDYVSLVKWVTRRALHKLRRHGQVVEFDDLHQEVCLLWVRCRDRYDPALGVKFSSYFANSAEMAMQQGWVARKILGKMPECGYLLSASTMSWENSYEGHNISPLDILIDENMPDPEERLITVEAITQHVTRSPLLQRLLELSLNPPPELHAQLAALKAQREYGMARGIEGAMQTPTALTPDLLCKAFGFNWRERKLASHATEGVL